MSDHVSATSNQLYDQELEGRVKKALERISENIHISANEPSLPVYRLQEHIRRSLPPMVSRRQHVIQLRKDLQGACYDVEYAISAVHAMKESSEHLSALTELLKGAIFHQQQLKYEQNRRKQKEPSMYKRLSSHIISLDLPELPDLPDAFRETASRMESALQHARTSYENHSRKEKEKKEVKGSEKRDVTNCENAGDREDKDNTVENVEHREDTVDIESNSAAKFVQSTQK